VTDGLDEAARERAETVREKRHERADPEDRVGRVRSQAAPPADLALPDPGTGGDVDLPDPIGEEFEEIRKKLTYGLDRELGVEMDPTDHYWPLVVHLGVQRLKGMWLEEVERTLETTEGVDAPE
jgi:hypothetical protein